MYFRSIQVVSVLVLFLFLSACAGSPENDEQKPTQQDCEQISFENADVEARESSIFLKEEFFKASAFVITKENWNNFYTEIPPELDLETYAYVFISRGGFPTGGYSVSVTEICHQDSTNIVRINLVDPGPEDIVIEAFTNPQTMVRIRTENWSEDATVSVIDSEGNHFPN